MFMYAWTFVRICVEARGQHRIPFSMAFPLIFWQCLWLNVKLSDWLDLPASNLFCFHLPSVGDYRVMFPCASSCGCWRSELLLTGTYFIEWAIILSGGWLISILVRVSSSSCPEYVALCYPTILVPKLFSGQLWLLVFQALSHALVNKPISFWLI